MDEVLLRTLTPMVIGILGPQPVRHEIRYCGPAHGIADMRLERIAVGA